jgi:hypothetical protein
MFDNEEFYVLLRANGTPIALDKPSGGYPTDARHPSHVEYFVSYQAADKYRNVMNELTWTIKKVEFNLVDIETPPAPSLAPGQVWQSGDRRVVILSIEGLRVEFYIGLVDKRVVAGATSRYQMVEVQQLLIDGDYKLI